MKLFYYSKDVGIEEQYKTFLKEYYKERFEAKWARFLWYSKKAGYHILLAEIDGELVGQSCVYPSKLTIDGEVHDIYWGVDNFVLSSYRGKGVGKALQKRLHEDFEGFSSTSYAGVNGHIKRKYGAQAISKTNFYFFPISTFFSLYLSLGICKVLKKHLGILRFRNLYAPPYYSKGVDIEVVNSWYSNDIEFVNHTLSNRYDMYVYRDYNYMKWKYVENPSVDYDILRIRKDGIIVAIVSLSKQRREMFAGVSLNTVKVLDFFNPVDSGMTDRQILSNIKTWIAKNRQSTDVLKGVTDINTAIKIKYHTRPFLTNMKNIKQVHRPYISCMDQDLEQMQ